MRFSRVLVLACALAGCGDSAPAVSGVVFDPCTSSPQPGYDPSSLPGCCTGIGPAHCVPSSQVLPALAQQFMPCDDTSVCLPDPIIRAGGSYVAASCTSSVKSSAGVCLSQCIPRVANDPQAALLGQDGCGDGELCVPCVNPLSGVSTGACQINDLICGADLGAMDAGPTVCPYVGPPIIDPTTLPQCSPTCGGAHCLPATLVPPAQQTLLTACTAANNMPGLCAPDPLIATGGNFVPKSCTSVAGAEGRCLSSCLPSVASMASLLPQDVCDTGEKCAPCYNPTASDPTAPTGACTLACDKPAQPPLILSCPWTGPNVVDPASFPACSPSCGGSHCVPSSLVSPSQQSLLAACPGGFCAPDAFIASAGNFVPKSCTSVAGAEGRCLSTCLPQVASEASVLPQDVCGAGERCAPCYNPTAQDPSAPTGACSVGCDHPTRPPVVLSCPWTGPPVADPSTFPACSCAGTHCVPSAMVPAGDQSLLAACTGGFCAPDDFIAAAGNIKPTACTSVAGAEGRCLSTCLPPVAAKASELPQDVCPTGDKCVPCYDPTSANPSAPTGACTIGCDMPTKSPVVLTCPWTGPNVVDPTVFPACSPACGGAHCLPASLVPAAEQALLATCPGGFCAPDPIIATDNNYVPPTCVSVAGAEGRCLSTCLPSIAAQAGILPQSTCAAGQKCAPCYNPTAADPTVPTGACSLACDHPAHPPTVLICPWTGPAVIDPSVLPSCASATCSNAHCLPAAYVPAADQAQLATCAGGYCTPDTIIQAGGNYKPPTCTSIAGAEGRCLSTCLPSIVAQSNVLPQSTCPTGTKCAPCYNPTAANPSLATGACSTASCDAPAHPPVTLTCPWNGPAVINPTQLPSCSSATCSGAHCLPSAYVPAADKSQLSTCGSGANAGYCVPDTIISTAGDVKPPACQPFDGQGEGRCMSTCLTSVESQASSLQQTSCSSGTLCAPCWDPFTGASTGACTSSSCDTPASGTPYKFPSCCAGSNPPATCVPSYEVPAGQQGSLAQNGCPGSFLCVPDEYIPNLSASYQPQTCNYLGLFAGACVNSCAVSGISLASSGQGSCGANHLCVSCTLSSLFGSAPPGC
jgi:hypothetical protein